MPAEVRQTIMERPQNGASLPSEDEGTGFVVVNCVSTYKLDDKLRTFTMETDTRSFCSPLDLYNPLADRGQRKVHFEQTPNVILPRIKTSPQQVDSILGEAFAIDPMHKRVDSGVEVEDDTHSLLDDMPFEDTTFEDVILNIPDLWKHQHDVPTPRKASTSMSPAFAEHGNNESLSGNSDNSFNDQVGNSMRNSSSAMQLYHPPTTFRPSLRATGGRPAHSNGTLRRALLAGLDPAHVINYQGSIGTFELANARLPGSENCCLFLTRIPAAVEYDLLALFNMITHGKVFSFSLNLPMGIFKTCAAKLCFMNRESAERFLQQATNRRGPGIRIYGQRIIAQWNREKIRPTESMTQKSRVVCFAGPGLGFYYLESILAGMYYDLIYWRDWSRQATHGEEGVVEMHFGSVRGQSQMAMACFHAFFAGDNKFSAWYAPDPCDVSYVE